MCLVSSRCIRSMPRPPRLLPRQAQRTVGMVLRAGPRLGACGSLVMMCGWTLVLQGPGLLPHTRRHNRRSVLLLQV